MSYGIIRNRDQVEGITVARRHTIGFLKQIVEDIGVCSKILKDLEESIQPEFKHIVSAEIVSCEIKMLESLADSFNIASKGLVACANTLRLMIKHKVS